MDDELNGWGPALGEIARRKADALAMGGEARRARQHDRGRLDARERLEILFDPGTFAEIGTAGRHRPRTLRFPATPWWPGPGGSTAVRHWPGPRT